MERLVANGGIFIGEGAVVEGPIYFVFGNCELLELSGGTFHQNLDLTGTRITNALVLELRHGPTHWVGNPLLICATLLLRRSRICPIPGPLSSIL